MWQVWEVYRLEVTKTSVETAEKRRRNVDDVQKRSSYRIAHGLEDENSQGLGGWMAKSDNEVLGPGLNVDGAVGRPVGVDHGQHVKKKRKMNNGNSRESLNNDWEGRK